MGASIATAPEVVNDLAATRGKGEQHRQSRLLLNLRVNVYIHCIVNFIIVVCSCRGPSSAGGFGSTYQVLSLSCPYFPSFLTQIPISLPPIPTSPARLWLPILLVGTVRCTIV